eukprot:5272257-Prymnesium_polylepis.1
MKYQGGWWRVRLEWDWRTSKVDLSEWASARKLARYQPFDVTHRNVKESILRPILRWDLESKRWHMEIEKKHSSSVPQYQAEDEAVIDQETHENALGIPQLLVKSIFKYCGKGSMSTPKWYEYGNCNTWRDND